MKKVLQGSLIALIAVVGSANATSMTIGATHKVLVYVNYGDNEQAFQLVDKGYPIKIYTGAFSQDRSKIQSIVWKETTNDGTIKGWITTLDIPRVLAGAKFVIKDNGAFVYDFNIRGKGEGQATEITQANNIGRLVGAKANDVLINLTANITALGSH